MTRWIAIGLTIIFIGNGLFMLAAPYPWYLTIPGVIQTGPFNDHFVRDVGATYLACGVGTLLGALDLRRHAGAVAVAATFQGAHALIHLITPFCGGGPPWPLLARDVPGVFLPTVLTIWLAVVAFRPVKES
ncbi:DUF4345 family protein [Caulobacter sp. 1776]|uniref:DUF4345 family protein n=1 Tax=Caulobacter sp. 1776 TaxID=3156420 RepID=UPI0033925369